MSKRKKPGLFCLNQRAWGHNPPLPTPGHPGAPVHSCEGRASGAAVGTWEAKEDAGQSLTPPPDPALAPAPSPRSCPTGLCSRGWSCQAWGSGPGPGNRPHTERTEFTGFMAQEGQRNS